MSATTWQLDLLDNETDALPLESFGGVGGYFAYIEFDASFTGSIHIYHGPTQNLLTRITDLDMDITADAGPHTFDIATRAKAMKLVINSVDPFNADVTITRK